MISANRIITDASHICQEGLILSGCCYKAMLKGKSQTLNFSVIKKFSFYMVIKLPGWKGFKALSLCWLYFPCNQGS